jgi:hypothetical protein
MGDKDRAKDDSQTPEITRRATFKLATAVAAFGAALGMRATSAQAKGEHIAKQPKRFTHWADKSTKYRESGSKKGGSGYIKLKKNDKN